MSDIIKLVPTLKAEEKNRDGVIEYLREILAKAEAGDIESVIVIEFTPRGAWRFCITGGDALRNIGALRMTTFHLEHCYASHPEEE